MSHTIKVQESSKLLRHNCEEFFSPLCKSLYFGCEWLICIITVQLFFHSWTVYKCHSNLIGSYTFNTYLSLMWRIFNLFTRRWKKAPFLHFKYSKSNDWKKGANRADKTALTLLKTKFIKRFYEIYQFFPSSFSVLLHLGLCLQAGKIPAIYLQ